ncbi:hypothetical protein AB0D27_45090 [Streptomyces sp. NPDC048415]|uniref:hypothetical protein n=1 Tax=Streptomyces sp. NPDC048415 TaxID=3154822 RepID=UPI00343FFB7A
MQSAGTPLYYLPGGRDGKNRAAICDEASWAKNNYDPEAMNTSTDTPDCDEFTFNASYNSGGMPANLGGLNPVSSGSKCIQSYATKVDGKIHLRNLPGALTTFKEVCGRSAISGSQNRAAENTLWVGRSPGQVWGSPRARDGRFKGAPSTLEPTTLSGWCVR